MITRWPKALLKVLLTEWRALLRQRRNREQPETLATRTAATKRRPPLDPFLKHLLVLLLLVGGGSAFAAEKEKKPDPAKIKVEGLGWIKERETGRTLSAFVRPNREATLPVGAIEDAAFVLVSELISDGYQHPKIRGEVRFADGSVETFDFNETLATVFPRKPGAVALRFDVEPGVRSFVQEVVFTGLEALEEETATGFFQGPRGLIKRYRGSIWSENVVQRGRNALLESLRTHGQAQAQVEVRSRPLEKPAGAMRLEVDVREGPRWMVSSVAVNVAPPTAVSTESLSESVHLPWSDGWRQDTTLAARKLFYVAGYPDVSARVRHEAKPFDTRVTNVAATVEIQPGPPVKIGAIRYEGAARTREGVIKRRVRLEPGDPLDPLALESARLRLGRLAAFTGVESRTEPVSDNVRDVVFRFTEAEPWAASMLFGYGSYEQFRIGAELKQPNLWGRAHQTRLLLVQSVKSTRGDYTYTVPDLFGEAIDGSARVFGLRREERSFLREEYGTSVMLRKRFGRRGPEVVSGYTFEALRGVDNTLATSAVDSEQVTSASVNLGVTLDRRDQAIIPRAGYRVFTRTEWASENLGGEVDYQRIEWGAAYHRALARDQWLHLGLTQSAVFTMGGDPAVPPPVNKLYYPGGDHSLRGYPEGEAAPRDGTGGFLGAKTFTLLNVELEQALAAQWSAVLFVDWLVESARLRDYPGDVSLATVGIGVRYRTIVGPVRLEYGRNVNPRPQDPKGTLHLSVGYPF